MKKISFKQLNKGFTLAELLIVVAIIGVLVAIGIPTFVGQLEKAREATDLTNIRGQYTTVMIKALEGEKDASETVNLTQTKDGWQTQLAQNALESLGTVNGTPTAKGTAVVSYDSAAKNSVKFTFDGGSGGPQTNPDVYYDANWTGAQKAKGLGNAIKGILNNISTEAYRYITAGDGAKYDFAPYGETEHVTGKTPQIWFDDLKDVQLEITKDGQSAAETVSLTKYLSEKGIDMDAIGKQYDYGNYRPTLYLKDDMKTPLAFFYAEPGNAYKGYLYYFDDDKTATIEYTNAEGYNVPINREDGAYYARNEAKAFELPVNQ